MSQHHPIVPVVSIVNNKPTTTSLNVAEVFEKSHKHVIEAIRSLNCPQDFAGPNFRLSEYNDSTGRRLPMYHLTRDGFTLLVMGFTGAKAMKFKLAYIGEFNRMEAELRRLESVESRRRSLAEGFFPPTESLIPLRVNLVKPTALPTWFICAGCGKELSKWAFGKTPEAPHGGFCIRCRRKLRKGEMAPEVEAAAMALFTFQQLQPVAKRLVRQMADYV